jgi:hypothetical protein
VLGAGGAAIALACGITIRRDYSGIPVGQIGFDDRCGLQDYFDTIEARLARPPQVVSAVDVEAQGNRRIRGGKNRFAFETEFQLKHLLRVLNENWSRLPDSLANASRIDVEVHWSEKAGVRRVVTDADAELIIKGESFPLPYHVCLSELLFGEPLYHQRREMIGASLPFKPLIGDASLAAPPPEPARPNVPAPDAGSAAPPAPAAIAPPAPAPAPSRPPVFKSAPPAR